MIGAKIEVTSAGLLVNEKKALRKIWRQAGNEIANAARQKIRKSTGTGRVYYVEGSSGAKGKYRASAPGLAPTSISGKLAGSLKVYPYKSGEGVAVRSRMFYALFLENGASGGGNVKGGAVKQTKSGTMRQTTATKARSLRQLLPRPFLTAALAERSTSIGKRVYDAICNDIQFKKMK